MELVKCFQLLGIVVYISRRNEPALETNERTRANKSKQKLDLQVIEGHVW